VVSHVAPSKTCGELRRTIQNREVIPPNVLAKQTGSFDEDNAKGNWD
jgi:tRNA uridine 5-carbamoylmethylation protein Kti12